MVTEVEHPFIGKRVAAALDDTLSTKQPRQHSQDNTAKRYKFTIPTRQAKSAQKKTGR